jgi:hypothetical protein
MENLELRIIIKNLQHDFLSERYLFNDKMKFKELVSGIVKTPKTYAFITDLKDYDSFWQAQEGLSEFVFKPNHLSRGRFIYVLQKEHGRLVEHDGAAMRPMYFEDIAKQVLLCPAITSRHGVIMEEVIHSHPKIRELWGDDRGIGDMRLFMLYDKILFGKLRMPSKKSRYYANVSRGAPVVHVNNKGIIEYNNVSYNNLRAHPDIPDRSLVGLDLPFWNQFEEAGIAVAKMFKVPFHSVDLTVNESGTAIVLESEFLPDLSYITPQGARFIINQI